MKKLTTILIASSLAACTPYVEFVHGSGATAGPVRIAGNGDGDELEINLCGAGLRHRAENGFYVDGALYAQCVRRSEAEDHPYFIGRLGYEFK